MWEHEYPLWERFYPWRQGGVVLDIGAEPESTRWFREHGCRTIPIGHAYGQHIDAIKIDIEGAERGMIVETHFPNPRLHLLHRFENGVQLWRLDGDAGLYR